MALARVQLRARARAGRRDGAAGAIKWLSAAPADCWCAQRSAGDAL